ncbi:MAG: hypothetical protein JNL28_01305 [Planctomycetes bacterium]|nr:hypothetical protein [Planctomycetota bacterium]
MEFSDTQGTKHLTMPDAGGGGSCLLFLSPPSMETKSIAGIRVMYDANAKWLK